MWVGAKGPSRESDRMTMRASTLAVAGVLGLSTVASAATPKASSEAVSQEDGKRAASLPPRLDLMRTEVNEATWYGIRCMRKTAARARKRAPNAPARLPGSPALPRN